MKPDELCAAAAEAAGNSASVEEAINRTGALLAEADAAWSSLKNANQPTAAALNALLVTSIWHCAALAAGAMAVDSLSTRLVALYASELDRVDEAAVNHARLAHWTMAFNDLMNAARETRLNPQADAAVAEHLRLVSTYIASMLSHYLGKADAATCEPDLLADARRVLGALARVVQSPLVDVNGAEVDPSADALPLMADLLGRCRALGIFVAN